MASGGARARSGPPPQEGSARSEVRGIKLDALPASGWRGYVPVFPLPMPDCAGAEDLRRRELELWKWAWRTPQAAGWSKPENKWMTQWVARWVRMAVLCENPNAKAADHAQLHRYAEQIGLSPAGLARLGWKIVDKAPAPRRKKAAEDAVVVSMPARRMRDG